MGFSETKIIVNVNKNKIIKTFYCSLDRDQPFSFQIGSGQVIKGWDQGLLDMCVGKWTTFSAKIT